MNKIKSMGKDDEISIEGIPLVANIPEQDQLLPNPGLLEFYNDLRNRVLYIDDGVETQMAVEIHKLILAWNREDRDIPLGGRKPIKIMIHSPGGSVPDMNTIIDTIMLSKTPVYTYNIGMAYSAGLDILLAGSKRYCTPKSEALLHSGYFSVQGPGGAVVDTSENYKRALKKFEEWVLARTKIDKALYGKKKKTEWYLDAEEQVKYGVVDAIVTDIDDLLN